MDLQNVIFNSFGYAPAEVNPFDQIFEAIQAGTANNDQIALLRSSISVDPQIFTPVSGNFTKLLHSLSVGNGVIPPTLCLAIEHAHMHHISSLVKFFYQVGLAFRNYALIEHVCPFIDRSSSTLDTGQKFMLIRGLSVCLFRFEKFNERTPGFSTKIQSLKQTLGLLITADSPSLQDATHEKSPQHVRTADHVHDHQNDLQHEQYQHQPIQEPQDAEPPPHSQGQNNGNTSPNTQKNHDNNKYSLDPEILHQISDGKGLSSDDLDWLLEKLGTNQLNLSQAEFSAQRETINNPFRMIRSLSIRESLEQTLERLRSQNDAIFCNSDNEILLLIGIQATKAPFCKDGFDKLFTYAIDPVYAKYSPILWDCLFANAREFAHPPEIHENFSLKQVSAEFANKLADLVADLQPEALTPSALDSAIQTLQKIRNRTITRHAKKQIKIFTNLFRLPVEELSTYLVRPRLDRIIALFGNKEFLRFGIADDVNNTYIGDANNDGADVNNAKNTDDKTPSPDIPFLITKFFTSLEYQLTSPNRSYDATKNLLLDESTITQSCEILNYMNKKDRSSIFRIFRFFYSVLEIQRDEKQQSLEQQLRLQQDGQEAKEQANSVLFLQFQQSEYDTQQRKIRTQKELEELENLKELHRYQFQKAGQNPFPQMIHDKELDLQDLEKNLQQIQKNLILYDPHVLKSKHSQEQRQLLQTMQSALPIIDIPLNVLSHDWLKFFWIDFLNSVCTKPVMYGYKDTITFRNMVLKLDYFSSNRAIKLLKAGENNHASYLEPNENNIPAYYEDDTSLTFNSLLLGLIDSLVKLHVSLSDDALLFISKHINSKYKHEHDKSFEILLYLNGPVIHDLCQYFPQDLYVDLIKYIDGYKASKFPNIEYFHLAVQLVIKLISDTANSQALIEFHHLTSLNEAIKHISRVRSDNHDARLKQDYETGCLTIFTSDPEHILAVFHYLSIFPDSKTNTPLLQSLHDGLDFLMTTQSDHGIDFDTISTYMKDWKRLDIEPFQQLFQKHHIAFKFSSDFINEQLAQLEADTNFDAIFDGLSLCQNQFTFRQTEQFLLFLALKTLDTCVGSRKFVKYYAGKYQFPLAHNYRLFNIPQLQPDDPSHDYFLSICNSNNFSKEMLRFEHIERIFESNVDNDQNQETFFSFLSKALSYTSMNQNLLQPLIDRFNNNNNISFLIRIIREVYRHQSLCSIINIPTFIIPLLQNYFLALSPQDQTLIVNILVTNTTAVASLFYDPITQNLDLNDPNLYQNPNNITNLAIIQRLHDILSQSCEIKRGDHASTHFKHISFIINFVPESHRSFLPGTLLPLILNNVQIINTIQITVERSLDIAQSLQQYTRGDLAQFEPLFGALSTRLFPQLQNNHLNANLHINAHANVNGNPHQVHVDFVMTLSTLAIMLYLAGFDLGRRYPMLYRLLNQFTSPSGVSLFLRDDQPNSILRECYLSKVYLTYRTILLLQPQRWSDSLDYLQNFTRNKLVTCGSVSQFLISLHLANIDNILVSPDLDRQKFTTFVQARWIVGQIKDNKPFMVEAVETLLDSGWTYQSMFVLARLSSKVELSPLHFFNLTFLKLLYISSDNSYNLDAFIATIQDSDTPLNLNAWFPTFQQMILDLTLQQAPTVENQQNYVTGFLTANQSNPAPEFRFGQQIQPQHSTDLAFQLFPHYLQLHSHSINGVNQNQRIPQLLALQITPKIDAQDVLNALLEADKALHDVVGYYLHYGQVLACLSSIISCLLGQKGICLQVKTGEGKTHINNVVAAVLTKFGRTVNVVTSSPILAKEAKKAAEPLFTKLGLTCDHNENPIERKSCYRSDVVFGDLSNFLHSKLFSRVKNDPSIMPSKDNPDKIRPEDVMLMDEVDHVMIDNFNSGLRLSGSVSLSDLQPLYVYIWSVIHKNDKINTNKKDIRSEIIQHFDSLNLPNGIHEYALEHLDTFIDNAIDAFSRQENVTYIVDKSKASPRIVIIDLDTGVRQDYSSWSHGLHQFLELKHKITLSDENLVTFVISNIAYIRQFKSFVGLTGTIGDTNTINCFKTLNNAEVVIIPPFKTKRYIQYPSILVPPKNVNEFYEHLHASFDHQQASLVICENIKTAHDIFKRTQATFPHRNIKLYTLSDDHESLSVITTPGPGSIIITTNLSGRGNDFSTSLIEHFGGLKVILTYVPPNIRIEEQAFGRTSRQGHLGSGQFIIFPDKPYAGITLDTIKAQREKRETRRLESMGPEISYLIWKDKQVERCISQVHQRPKSTPPLSRASCNEIEFAFGKFLAKAEKDIISRQNNQTIDSILKKFGDFQFEPSVDKQLEAKQFIMNHMEALSKNSLSDKSSVLTSADSLTPSLGSNYIKAMIDIFVNKSTFKAYGKLVLCRKAISDQLSLFNTLNITCHLIYGDVVNSVKQSIDDKLKAITSLSAIINGDIFTLQHSHSPYDFTIHNNANTDTTFFEVMDLFSNSSCALLIQPNVNNNNNNNQLYSMNFACLRYFDHDVINNDEAIKLLDVFKNELTTQQPLTIVHLNGLTLSKFIAIQDQMLLKTHPRDRTFQPITDFFRHQPRKITINVSESLSTVEEITKTIDFLSNFGQHVFTVTFKEHNPDFNARLFQTVLDICAESSDSTLSSSSLYPGCFDQPDCHFSSKSVQVRLLPNNFNNQHPQQNSYTLNGISLNQLFAFKAYLEKLEQPVAGFTCSISLSYSIISDDPPPAALTDDELYNTLPISVSLSFPLIKDSKSFITSFRGQKLDYCTVGIEFKRITADYCNKLVKIQRSYDDLPSAIQVNDLGNVIKKHYPDIRRVIKFRPRNPTKVYAIALYTLCGVAEISCGVLAAIGTLGTLTPFASALIFAGVWDFGRAFQMYFSQDKKFSAAAFVTEKAVQIISTSALHFIPKLLSPSAIAKTSEISSMLCQFKSPAAGVQQVVVRSATDQAIRKAGETIVKSVGTKILSHAIGSGVNGFVSSLADCSLSLTQQSAFDKATRMISSKLSTSFFDMTNHQQQFEFSKQYQDTFTISTTSLLDKLPEIRNDLVKLQATLPTSASPLFDKLSEFQIDFIQLGVGFLTSLVTQFASQLISKLIDNLTASTNSIIDHILESISLEKDHRLYPLFKDYLAKSIDKHGKIDIINNPIKITQQDSPNDSEQQEFVKRLAQHMSKVQPICKRQLWVDDMNHLQNQFINPNLVRILKDHQDMNLINQSKQNDSQNRITHLPVSNAPLSYITLSNIALKFTREEIQSQFSQLHHNDVQKIHEKQIQEIQNTTPTKSIKSRKSAKSDSPKSQKSSKSGRNGCNRGAIVNSICQQHSSKPRHRIK